MLSSFTYQQSRLSAVVGGEPSQHGGENLHCGHVSVFLEGGPAQVHNILVVWRLRRLYSSSAWAYLARDLIAHANL